MNNELHALSNARARPPFATICPEKDLHLQLGEPPFTSRQQIKVIQVDLPIFCEAK